MKLSGSYKINVKKEAVWIALNDSNVLKKCIPGCDSFEKESDSIFNATATNQIGPMNATFAGKVTLSNIQKNQSYTLSGEGQSAVGFVISSFGNFWSMFGSIFFLLACIVFLIPFFKKDKKN